MIHVLAYQKGDRRLTRCGVEDKAAVISVWRSEATCEPCRDSATPWPVKGADGEKAWFAGRAKVVSTETWVR